MINPNSPYVYHDEPGALPPPVVHPTQQRLSCEGCRKHKAKCQRINPDDPKCGRCMMHKMDCNVGTQKRVGRPRRAAAELNQCTPGRRSRGPGSKAPNASRSKQQIPSPSSDCSPAVSFSASSSPGSDTHDGTITVQNNSFLPLPQPADQDTTFTINSSMPFPLPLPLDLNLVQRPVGLSASLNKLSILNLDLHTRMETAEAYKHIVDLNFIIYRQGPLFINNATLAEFTLRASRQYLSILTDLQSAVALSKWPYTTNSPPHGDVCLSPPLSTHPYGQQLTTPMTLVITSIFAQLLDLYELNLRHLLARLERFAIDPIAPTPLPGLVFGTRRVEDPCMQGILFVGTIRNLLQGIEKALGISWNPENGDGLLSPRQQHTLWNEIGEEFGTSITRPEFIKTSMQQAISSFRRLMAGQLPYGPDTRKGVGAGLVCP